MNFVSFRVFFWFCQDLEALVKHQQDELRRRLLLIPLSRMLIDESLHLHPSSIDHPLLGRSSHDGRKWLINMMVSKSPKDGVSLVI